ncbi:MAG: hypothetical protein M3032_08865 [Verrucomicrobiota bacterium]|nr:hypothetical protein [Verrucomicrobiota bacterium]
MPSEDPDRFVALRILLTADAAVLLSLGFALIFVPDTLAGVFHFGHLPDVVDYIGGFLGCAFVSLGAGYVMATTDPIRHAVWVVIGIARGAFEVLLSIACVLRGAVTWQQASFGIAFAAFITVGYAILYPRAERR